MYVDEFMFSEHLFIRICTFLHTLKYYMKEFVRVFVCLLERTFACKGCNQQLGNTQIFVKCLHTSVYLGFYFFSNVCLCMGVLMHLIIQISKVAGTASLQCIVMHNKSTSHHIIRPFILFFCIKIFLLIFFCIYHTITSTMLQNIKFLMLLIFVCRSDCPYSILGLLVNLHQ